jgi:hypothetical protein
MKTDILKKIIKESVREVIQEELKEILLEAVRAPKVPVGVGGYGTVAESTRDTYAQPHIDKPKQLSAQERRDMFSGILGEMQNGGAATSAYAGTFNPKGAMPGGDLPPGEVGLDQIMNLMSK